MDKGKKEIGVGLAIAAIVAVFAVAGFSLFKGTGRKEKAKDPATAAEYTQMRGMFQQMQQSGGAAQGRGMPGGNAQEAAQMRGMMQRMQQSAGGVGNPGNPGGNP